jgi:hypothetical protein
MPDAFSIRRSTSIDPIPLVGHVESIHGSSANLRLEGALWNATIRRDALHPQGILIPETILRAIEVGHPARLTSALLEIGPNRLEAGPLIEEPEIPDRIDAEMLDANLSRLERHLRLFGRASIVRATILEGRDPETATIIHNLLKSGAISSALRPPTSTPSPSSLRPPPSAFPIGGGEGSTPAWDDFLTGVILADHLLSGGRFLEALPDALCERTTELSALQLIWAREGRSALVIEELIAALAVRPIPSSLIARCFSLGHSSGSDIVTGVHAALKT